MANKRIISGLMWEDDFFTSLNTFERLLWIGLITCAADDQGRFQDSASLVRAKVFPLDDIKISDVESALCKYENSGKIVRYTVASKKVVQIINWWKHQAPNWAGRSIFPPPPKWIDRERYHGKENKIVSVNWALTGGYIADYIGTNDSDEVKGEVKGDIDVNGEGEAPPPPPLFPDDNWQVEPFEVIRRHIVKETGLPGDGENAVKAIDEIVAMNATEADVSAGIAWIIGEGRQIKYYSQIPGPTRTAMQKRIQGSNGHAPAKPVKYAEEY